jgi:hypothetical protein
MEKPAIFLYGSQGTILPNSILNNESTIPVNSDEARKEYISGMGPGRWNHTGTGNKRKCIYYFYYK